MFERFEELGVCLRERIELMEKSGLGDTSEAYSIRRGIQHFEFAKQLDRGARSLNGQTARDYLGSALLKAIEGKLYVPWSKLRKDLARH